MTVVAGPEQRGRVVGRYTLFDEIASGGMAAVYLARLDGPLGFARTVAMKRLHGHLANDPELIAMFEDEARLTARIRHPNVVPVYDVLVDGRELFLVMEYVHGESLAKLLGRLARSNARVPLPVASAILGGVLRGLHAAHEAKNEHGEPLDLVHRDVSPQNVMVGADGVARVLDFGIAKAIGRSQPTTHHGQVKGKAAYMAPEHLRSGDVDARTDVYGASVVLWEMLTGERLFAGASAEATVNLVLERTVPPPSSSNPEVPAALDALVLRGLSRDRARRFASAREMEALLESVVRPATPSEVAAWVESVAADVLQQRAALVEALEKAPPLASAYPGVDGAGSMGADAEVTRKDEAPAVSSTRPTRWGLLGGIAMAVLLAMSLVIALSRRPGDHDVSQTGAPPAEPVATSSVAVSGADGAEPASAEPAPETPATVVRRPRPAPAAKPVQRATRKCDPPYVIDANGFRSPKPECL